MATKPIRAVAIAFLLVHNGLNRSPSSASALRFFFKVTLGRADLVTQLARVHYPRRLPRVLSPEMMNLIAA